MQMLHRPSIKSSDGNAISTTTLAQAPVDQGQDVFNDGEADPLKSRAIESSLWEMEALKNHSSPMVCILKYQLRFCFNIDITVHKALPV